MSETSATKHLLHRAYLYITEQQEKEALATLDQISINNKEEQVEVAYLRAWCYTLEEHWDEAAQFLLDPEISGENITDIQSIGQTERRRRAYYLLLLGNIASNLGRFEEATRHYAQCIKFLDERRMNVPGVRLRARMGLGTAYTQTGYYAVALTHYEDALRLCKDDDGHVDVPDICYGMADAHRHLGNFEQAIDFSKRALQIYVQRSQKDLEGRMRNLLGRIYYQMRDFQTASYYYTEALALSMLVNRPGMMITNLTALADLRLEEGLLDEARRYSENARQYIDRSPSPHYVGMAYIVSGKVAEAEANQTTGQKAKDLQDEAIGWYKKAITTLSPLEVKVELSEAYGRLAQLLEITGKQGEALQYWREAYSVYSPRD